MNSSDEFDTYHSVDTETSTTASTSAPITPKKRKNRSWIITSGWVRVMMVDGTKKLQCTKCNRMFSYQNNSTSSAIRHVQSHGIRETSIRNGTVGDQSTIEAAFASNRQDRTVHSVALFKKLVCKLLIEARLPFQLVENPSFQQLLFYAQSAPNISHILLPSADTAHSWMTEAFTSGMEKIIEELKLQPSICYTTDLWTSDWMDSYMCITAHWIDNEWNKREVVIGFEFMTGLHTGRENTIVQSNFTNEILIISS